MSTAMAAPMAIQTVVDDVLDGAGGAALTGPLPADAAGIPSQPSVTVVALTVPLPAAGFTASGPSGGLACAAATDSAITSNDNTSRPKSRAIGFCAEVLICSPLDASAAVPARPATSLSDESVSLSPPHSEYAQDLPCGNIGKHVSDRVNSRWLDTEVAPPTMGAGADVQRTRRGPSRSQAPGTDQTLVPSLSQRRHLLGAALSANTFANTRREAVEMDGLVGSVWRLRHPCRHGLSPHLRPWRSRRRP